MTFDVAGGPLFLAEGTESNIAIAADRDIRWWAIGCRVNSGVVAS